MLYSYSVTPLKEDNFEARCNDIIKLYNDGVILMPIFSMTLVPESVSLMQPDGSLEPIEFASLGDDKYSINTRVEPMYPVILIIK